ncbi:hypothetical protein HBB16_09945 [Pseudonocardia sp. MCCB 268]|nr:hypothetical protein [Pseudonocardia cytotoxica]
MIGYASMGWRCYRFHPPGRRQQLRELGADGRICGLVAFITPRPATKPGRGVAPIASPGLPNERGLVRDLLWYLDMTTSLTASRSRSPPGSLTSAPHPPEHHVIGALELEPARTGRAVDRATRWLYTIGTILDHP